MYCSNCGMKLPDWAHFCERCGMRLQRRGAAEDPLDRVGLEDTSASEPLWADDVATDEQEPLEPEMQEQKAQPVEPLTGMTVPMEIVAAETEDDEPEPAEEPAVAEPVVEEPLAEEAPAEEPPAEEPPAEEEPAEETPAEEAPAEEPPAPEPVRETQPAEQSQPDERRPIDVGERNTQLGGSYAQYSRMSSTWQGRQRASERYRQESAVSMRAVALAAAAALVLGLLVSLYLFANSKTSGSSGDTAIVKTERVSKKQAAKVIEALDGWWTTDRKFDGRYWYVQDAVMETFAADGQLAKQVLIDVGSVQHMSTGPGGIEGSGYFLRDIGYFLLDDDQDTLYAIDGDGSADESANLFRIDAPAFVNTEASGDSSEKTTTDTDLTDEELASEFILPESGTRLYDVFELESLSDHDLFVARNEIYARHGYAFEEGELSEYFKSKSWYHPSDIFNEGEISEIEHQNVTTILSLEYERGSQYV